MRILITCILKGLVTITLGGLAQMGLVFLALVMWNGKFIDIAQDVTDTIWKKRISKHVTVRRT